MVVGVRGAVCPLGLWPHPRGYFRTDEIGIFFKPVGDGGGLGSPGGAEDRRIAGAAAEIAGEVVIVAPVAVQMGRGHRSDEARRAKAALAAVMGDHGLLDGMHLALGAGDAFDGADGFAFELWQEKDAGIDRAGAGLVAQDDGTGAAIAFVAALFRAFQPACVAQPVEQRPCGAFGLRDLGFNSVQPETDTGHSSIRRDTPCGGVCACRPDAA